MEPFSMRNIEFVFNEAKKRFEKKKHLLNCQRGREIYPGVDGGWGNKNAINFNSVINDAWKRSREQSCEEGKEKEPNYSDKIFIIMRKYIYINLAFSLRIPNKSENQTCKKYVMFYQTCKKYIMF